MSKMFGYVDASADKYHGRCQGHQSGRVVGMSKFQGFDAFVLLC